MRLARRDRGATLVMILVLITIAGLLVLPTMAYAVTVLRANRVVSTRTASAEAAKGGLRTALADPRWLYEQCSTPAPTALALPQLDIATSTTCELVQEVTRYDTDDLPWAVSTTWFGATAVANELVEGTNRPGDHSTDPVGDENSWLNVTTPDRVAAPAMPGFENERSIWIPQLPSPATTIRSPDGFPMASGQINPGYASCTVFFPGTYPEPVQVTGATYFTSGVYYFEAPLTIVDGASVVFGSGQQLGCTDDQRAAFSAIGVPSTHNITGVGATIVFGADGRLSIGSDRTTNQSPISFKMNTRYVAPDSLGLLPSVEVSIQSVNGTTDETGADVDLHIGGALNVPVGVVGGETPGPPSAAGYRPSTVVATSTAPTAVPGVSADAYDGAIVVEWASPAVSYGVEGYVATAVPNDGSANATCAVAWFRRSCMIDAVSNGVTYTVYVVAANATGGSPPSTGVEATPSGSAVAAPAPDAVDLDQAVEVFDNGLRLTWPDPTGASPPVDVYTATVPAVTADDGAGGVLTVFDGGACTSDGEFNECLVSLPDGVADQITAHPVEGSIVASNPAGDSTSAATQLSLTRVAGTYVAPTSPTQEPPSESVPIIDISTDSSAAIEVDIPGHVAVPQGAIVLSHPSGTGGSLRIDGGVLAATIEVPLTCGTARCVVGQTNEPIQRVVRIITVTTDGIETRSDAVAQINSNGAWVVNSWEVESH